MENRLETNRSRILERIGMAAQAAGRDPSEIQLVVVTKGRSIETTIQVHELGCQDLGENRASALEEKHAAFLAEGRIARWHFVGHLQRNKARRVLRLAHTIHSVDSVPLWEALARLAQEEERSPGIYLQVKLADEDAKGGLTPAEVPDLVERARKGPLPLLGLMTLAPLFDDPVTVQRRAREVFESATALAHTLPTTAFVDGRVRLSMGMSQDLEQAVRAGSHVLRVGSALFEEGPLGKAPRVESGDALERRDA